MTSIPIPFAGTVRRHTRRTVRSVLEASVGLYLKSLDLRGRMTTPELKLTRAVCDAYLVRQWPADDDIDVATVDEPFDRARVRGEWHEAPGATDRSGPILLYVHGGGFVFGSPETHRTLTGELSRRLGWPAFSVDYRLAPEHPHPAAADDVLRAWRWLLDRGVDPSRVVVAGDSAGGHLALGLPSRAVRASMPVPAAVVALSPAADPGFTEALAMAEPPDRSIPVGAAVAVVRAYGQGADDPDLRLTVGDLSVMPPTLVHAAEHEFCGPDAAAYVTALREVGGTVEYRTWPRTWHVFHLAHRRLRAADEALDDIVRFAHGHVDRPTP
ncbi:alpha/beta hydrolase [Euzebya rosea]|uniref:alpha/beta hydrolase n=1 Tax=Euzebya rosea TaxID=2052804 RepID=UPI001300B4A6|nr:alpha/beta hydrolase [Euzebya rosea]